ncbi:MAG TPA: 23S rRNA (guanosine(2251)-2'-O)-methyltransferase RlmB [Candidatus Kapabacteria bacterium]|nr:23S rRNA (guanosine(2251)-2'-O)-methyltransferase RlmB [Candidatus Kapabacteria bacterium]
MYINGRNAVIEALRSGSDVEKVFIMFGMEGEAIDRVRIEAKRAGVPSVIVDRQRFAELERRAGLGTRSQGVLAVASAVEYADMDELVESVIARGDVPLVGALDGITDPHNVGAIIRSAECAALDGIVIGKHDSSGITDVVMKTSAGAAGHLPIARVANVGDSVMSLKDAGLVIVGLDERGTIPYTAYDFTQPSAIIVGSEGRGIGQRVRRMCDTLLSIPMFGQVASLNASVASGVVFFEARRQRVEAGMQVTRRQRPAVEHDQDAEDESGKTEEADSESV